MQVEGQTMDNIIRLRLDRKRPHIRSSPRSFWILSM